MENCIFCKIVKKEIPASIVYEDDNVMAFLDIHPYNPGHTLVIPKVHSKNLIETPDNDLSILMLVSKNIAKAIENGLGAHGIQVRINTHEAGGQDVFHIHFHIVPKFLDDEKRFHRTSYSDGEKDVVLEKIKKSLP